MYYLLINGQKSGPFSAAEVKQYLQQGAIGHETQFWQDGMMNWATIGSAQHLFSNPAPPVYQQSPYQNQPGNYYPGQQQAMVAAPQSYGVSSKSRITFILLGFFLGGLGIHNFYAGYSSKGLTQLLLMIFLFWTFIVPLGIAIWVIVEIITVDIDADGNRMI